MKTKCYVSNENLVQTTIAVLLIFVWFVIILKMQVFTGKFNYSR